MHCDVNVTCCYSVYWVESNFLFSLLTHHLLFCSATTVKFDQVNPLVCASLWPITDCLLAPSPRAKQKSKLLRNLPKLQVSQYFILIPNDVYQYFNVIRTLLYFWPFLYASVLVRFSETVKFLWSMLEISFRCPNDDLILYWSDFLLPWQFTAKIWLDT